MRGLPGIADREVAEHADGRPEEDGVDLARCRLPIAVGVLGRDTARHDVRAWRIVGAVQTELLYLGDIPSRIPSRLPSDFARARSTGLQTEAGARARLRLRTVSTSPAGHRQAIWIARHGPTLAGDPEGLRDAARGVAFPSPVLWPPLSEPAGCT